LQYFRNRGDWARRGECKQAGICYNTSTIATKQQNYHDRIIVDPKILAG
jgi:hypothetical protein